MKKKVLITGASGRIGCFITKHLANRYEFILTDIRSPEETFGFQFIRADICNSESMRQVCKSIDTVVHLAANPNQNAPWEKIYPANIIGVYNVFQAAVDSNCKRVVFASSIHAIHGYPTEVQISTHMPVRPLNIYGAAKAWGEALARYYADQKNISMICLRIGGVTHRNSTYIHPNNPNLDMIITFEDLTRLVLASIEAPDDLRFGVFHGISNNRRKRLDISDTRTILGYEPEDDSFALAELNKTSTITRC